MRWLLPLVLLGCFLFYSCNNNEEENYIEEIVMTNVFYEDFFDIDNINFVADSLYFINSEEKFKQIKDKIPSIYTKISKTDFNRNTIIITAARQDYNIFTYEVKLFFNTMSKTCNLFINYVLEEPPYLEKTYTRVWVCVIPKISEEPHKSYIHNDIRKISSRTMTKTSLHKYFVGTVMP